MLIDADAQKRLTAGYDANLPENERKCILLPVDCDNLNHYWECYLKYKEEENLNLSRIFKVLNRILFYFSANVEEVFLVNNISAYDDVMRLFATFAGEIRFVNGQRFSDDDSDKLLDILRDIGEIALYIKKSKLLCEEVKRQYDGTFELEKKENHRNKNMYSMTTFIVGGVVIGCIIAGVVVFYFGSVAAAAVVTANTALNEAIAAGVSVAEIAQLTLALETAKAGLYSTAYSAGMTALGGVAGGAVGGVARTSFYSEKELKTLIDIKEDLIKKLKQHYAVHRAAAGPDDEFVALLSRNRNILFVHPVAGQNNGYDEPKEQRSSRRLCAIL